MKVFRLKNALQVLQHREFFCEGLEILRNKALFNLSDEDFFKKLFYYLTLGDHTFCGVVFTAEDEPLGFCVWLELTQPFDEHKTFGCWCFYQTKQTKAATQFLFKVFEKWAKERGAKCLQISTKRHSGAAKRCFSSYGFSIDLTTFKKEI